MKLKDYIRLDTLYAYDALVIPLEKGQIDEISEVIEEVKDLPLEEEITIKIAKKRKPRSHDANSYYFQLVRKIAYKRGLTVAEVHNRCLAESGIALTDKQGRKQWMLLKDDDWWLKQIEFHIAPTDKTDDRNGTMYRWFYALKPSHLMDSKEMSIVIDNIIEDAKSLGIETLSPKEIERLKESWK